MKFNFGVKKLLKTPLFLLFLASLSLFITPLAFSYTASNDEVKLDTQILGEKEAVKTLVKKSTENSIIYDKRESITFSVSDGFVNFGKVVPGESLERTITLMINNRSNFGYSVLTSENFSLTDANKRTVVPDATCDDGICSDLLASSWTSPLAYGFGYRCDNIKGSACVSGFEEGYYKQFPSLKLGKKMQPALVGSPASHASSKITYKLNLTPALTGGNYQNTTSFILVPNY